MNTTKDHKMKRPEREITDPETILQIINSTDVIRLGLYDGYEPYIVPMNFGFKANTFYMHCATHGRKIDILKNNPKVCFELDTDHTLVTSENACGWGMKYKCIMGTGRVEILSDEKEKSIGLTILMDHYNPSGKSKPYDFSKLMVKTSVLKLSVEKMTCKARD